MFVRKVENHRVKSRVCSREDQEGQEGIYPPYHTHQGTHHAVQPPSLLYSPGYTTDLPYMDWCTLPSLLHVGGKRRGPGLKEEI